MTHDNGGPAFPTQQWDTDTLKYKLDGGMTLRDYLAIHAELSKVEVNNLNDAVAIVGRKLPTVAVDQLVWQFDLLAKLRYMYADAMLKARKT